MQPAGHLEARWGCADLTLEHFPEKWMPVFLRKCDQVSTSRPLSDSTQSGSGLEVQIYGCKGTVLSLRSKVRDV